VRDFVTFDSKARKEAKTNLDKFIRVCRDDLTLYDSEVKKFNWTDWYWKSENKNINVKFVKLGVNHRRAVEKDWLSTPFIDFAKAYLRYQLSNKPTVNTKTQAMMALRALEKAYIDAGRVPDITQLNEDLLDDAELIAKNYFSKGAAYRAGFSLETLAKFVSVKNISEIYLDWSHSCPRENFNTNKTGIEGKRCRAKKMPRQAAIDAIAEVFSNSPTVDKDVFVTSTSLMLLSQPSRIGEVLRLRVDCDDIKVEFLKYIDLEGRSNTGYGWRFNAAKNYNPEIKWIPTVMQELAKDAVERLKKITQPARDFSLMMEKVIASEDPSFPRHPICPNVLDNQLLTLKEVALALGYENVYNVVGGDNLNKALANVKSDNSKYGRFEEKSVTLNDLTKKLINNLPVGFPWVDKARGVKYSNALFCFFQNQLNTSKSTLRTVLWIPSNSVFNNNISKKDKWDNWFGQHGYNEGRDSFIYMTSHMFRHYLNTLANDGELSQEEIAKWSGRKDISQNSVYNHESHEDRVNQLRKYNMDKSLMGGDLDIEINVPVTDTEFMTLERAPVHVSEFGFCEHDYALSPCLKFRDCSNCDEEVCIKGDVDSLERLKLFIEKVSLIVERDEDNINVGELDKNDQSYLYHKLKLARVSQKIEILESDEVQHGAEIRLRNPMATTPLERAIESRKRKGIDSKNNKIRNKMIQSAKSKTDELRILLGDDLG